VTEAYAYSVTVTVFCTHIESARAKPAKGRSAKNVDFMLFELNMNRKYTLDDLRQWWAMTKNE
jgi:hypothetical protein